MKLINESEIDYILIPIAPILKGEKVHYEWVAFRNQIEQLPSAQPKTGHWIPITYRPMTDEEKKHYSEYTGYNEEDFDTMFDCPLPEDGETVLITDWLGNVGEDTFFTDNDGCYFECNCDMEDVKAWMPLPEPYKAEREE